LCGDVQWTEERTKAADGTDLALVVTTISLPWGASRDPEKSERSVAAHVYVLYFQGQPSLSLESIIVN
jgi:hypothetical protein